MNRLNLRHNVAQFLIDLLFGVALISPLLYGVASGNLYSSMLVTIGVSVGYVLHMLQKVLLYEELLSEDVKDQVESHVEDTVPEAAEKQVKEQVKKGVEDAHRQRRDVT